MNYRSFFELVVPSNFKSTKSLKASAADDDI